MTFDRDDLDTISIDGLRVDCIVGLYPDERVRLQPLIVDVALSLDTRGAAARADIDATVDYAHLAAQVRFILEHGRFGMLETAGDALARWALSQSGVVDAVRVRLVKPDALGGDGVPSVAVVRRAEEVVLLPRDGVETIASSRVCRVERVVTAAPYQPATTEGEEAAVLVVGDGVVLVVVRKV